MNQSYANHTNVETYSLLKRINLDDECLKDLNAGNGHLIDRAKGTIKKDLKDEFGIFSPKFGMTLDDMTPYADRYKCSCGNLIGRVYNKIECPDCKTPVRFIDNNFEYTAWIKIDEPYAIIHPNLYKLIEFIIGAKKLENILVYYDDKDIDGHSKEINSSIKIEIPADEPFYGIGMISFKERFDEIMQYYVKKYPTKKAHYRDIIKNRDKIFARSIPVYTTMLRPYKVEGDNFHFGDTNKLYIMMINLVDRINRVELNINRRRKPKSQLLWDLQSKISELYAEIENILSGKKGQIRMLFGGRYNFTARNVIIPDPTLNVDEVTVAYTTLVELMQQRIINVLSKSYNITYNQAYQIWYNASISKNDRVWAIIENIINDGTTVTDTDGATYRRKGIPILINRNPTIFNQVV
jgi:DNA-directed RNA polymerase beta' subunit